MLDILHPQSNVLYGTGGQNQSAVAFNIGMAYANAGYTVLSLNSGEGDARQFLTRAEAYRAANRVSTRLDVRTVLLPARRTTLNILTAIGEAAEGASNAILIYDIARTQGMDDAWLDSATDIAKACTVLSVMNNAATPFAKPSNKPNAIIKCRETFNPLGVVLTFEKPLGRDDVRLKTVTRGELVTFELNIEPAKFGATA